MIIDKQVVEDAIETFGVNAQLDMVVEECSELIQAIQKLKRASNSNDHTKILEKTANVCEEIADVKIMITQLESIFMKHKHVIDTTIDFKIRRLKSRIKEHKKN